MKLVIFGASGRTGHELVSQALTLGHAVSAFVRAPHRLRVSHPGLTVITGEVTDYGAVARAVAGQEAAICALGAPSPLRRYPPVVEGVRNIVQAMQSGPVRRLIYLSFLGVREGRRNLGFLVNYIVTPLLHNVVADHELKESLVRQSMLDWTIVRPPRLTNGPRTGAYRSGEHIEGQSVVLMLSRADLSEFILRQLEQDTYLHKAPRVMY